MQRTFKNLKTNKTRSLEFNPSTGQVFFLNQWWDARFLRDNFSIVDQTPVEKLVPQQLPAFGNPSKYQGKWTTTRVKGSAEGTGAYI